MFFFCFFAMWSNSVSSLVIIECMMVVKLIEWSWSCMSAQSTNFPAVAHFQVTYDNCRFFQENLRMLMQSLRALCKAPEGCGSIWKFLQAPVRATGVSVTFVCSFQTDLHFANNLGLKFHLQVHCSLLTASVSRSQPSSVSPNTVDHGLQVHLQSRKIPASKHISTVTT